MKRRTIEGAKIRRNLKRSKISEGVCSSGLVYVKLLFIWTLVMLADFLLEFRFEYLWPFWLLMRSIYDSFRYQGVAFSMFFVCVAVTSDVVCFLFIPVQWLFFLASTYVWVQFVWHTDRGVCLPTVFLWVLFVYIEASVRLKELKNMSFTMDLCRPFAAHCIGYPVVTLGFGMKSYVSYKMRMRKQREIARENEFYMQLLQEALPAPSGDDDSLETNKQRDTSLSTDIGHIKAVCSKEDISISNGTLSTSPSPHQSSLQSSVTHVSRRRQGASRHTQSSSTALKPKSSVNNGIASPVVGGVVGGEPDVSSGVRAHASSLSMVVNSGSSTAASRSSHQWFNNDGLISTFWSVLGSLFSFGDASGNEAINSSGDDLNSFSTTTSWRKENDSDVEDGDEDDSITSSEEGGGAPQTVISTANNNVIPPSIKKRSPGSAPKKCSGTRQPNHHHRDNSMPSSKNDPNSVTSTIAGATTEKVQNKDVALSLESDLEKLRNDLRQSRAAEHELQMQLQQMTDDENSLKNELTQIKQTNEQLQTKLHNLVRARQQDKQTITTLEKRIAEEQKQRQTMEQQMVAEKKQKKAEEDAAAKAVALAKANKTDCTEVCKSRRKELESEVKAVRRDHRAVEERLHICETELIALRQYKESHGDTEVLMSALTAMQEKNSHLEHSLSAETRIKLDLFTALGEAKRQFEIAQTQYYAKERECQELRARLERLKASSSPLSPSPSLSMMNSSNDSAAGGIPQPYVNGFTPSISGPSFNTAASSYSPMIENENRLPGFPIVGTTVTQASPKF